MAWGGKSEVNVWMSAQFSQRQAIDIQFLRRSTLDDKILFSLLRETFNFVQLVYMDIAS